jgi:UDP-glucuronate decarboxylase
MRRYRLLTSISQDLIDGLIALMNADSRDNEEPVTSPVNLGSNQEITIRELVDIITNVLDEISQTRPVSPNRHKIEYSSLPVDDPRQRRPDITRAEGLLGWSPKWALRDGIKEMALSYLDRMEAGQL